MNPRFRSRINKDSDLSDKMMEVVERLDGKKFSMEKEMFEGGCAAVPTYIIKFEFDGELVEEKSIDIDSLFDNLLDITKSKAVMF